MADIVLGIGCSHGPSIQRDASQWAGLGKKDTRDPRFDYASLLMSAPPGLDREITLEVQHARHAAAQAAVARASELLISSHPDAVIVISNAHVIRPAEPRPVFSVLRAPAFPVVESIGRTFETAGDAHITAEVETAGRQMPGHPALADALVSGLNLAEIDVGCIDELPEGRALDEAFSFCYKWLFADRPIPIVPFFLSRDLPNQPTPRRCIQAGHALRKVLNEVLPGLRVAIVASGGLSHQVVDETLDRAVVGGLENGDFDALANLSRAQVNGAPGTPEVLNWIMLGAAMAPNPMHLIDYLPCYRSLAGTGHGVAVGHWD